MLGKIKKTLKKLKGKRYLYARYYKKSKVVKNRILFESFHGQSISDSSYFMLLALMQREECSQYEIFYASSKSKLAEHEQFVAEHHLPVKLVTIESIKYLKILATAEYLFNNNSFPAWYIRKDEQKYLQTWHGTPLKTLGKQMREGLESMFYAQHSFLQASHLLFPNEFTRDALMRDYNLTNLYTGKTVLCGYPRNSIFFDRKNAEEIRAKYGLEDKQLFAYMPTWRGANTSSVDPAYEADLRAILDQIDEVLTDDQFLYVNFHQLMRGMKGLDNYRHIRQFPQDVNNYAFLNCADALITDYSSVMFDYSITGKPIILFIYDYDEYMRERGMYFDIKDLPFHFAHTTEELSAYLTGEKQLDGSYEGTPYSSRFLGYDAADTPDRMLDVVLHGKEDAVPVTDYSRNLTEERRVIKPAVMEDPADLAAVSGTVEENDIVLLNRADFTEAIRGAMHETYNERFDYVIRTNAQVVSYWELLQQKLGSKRVKREVKLREMRRLFSKLPVQEKYITKLFVPEEGCSVRSAAPLRVSASVMQSESRYTLILKDTDRYTLEKILLVNRRLEITECFPADADGKQWSIDAEALAAVFPRNESCLIAGAVRDHKSGSVRYAVFRDPALQGHTIETIWRAGITDCFLKPVMTGPDRETGEESAITWIPYPRGWMEGFHVAKTRVPECLDRETWAAVTAFKPEKTKIRLRMELPAIPGMAVKDVVLRHRGKDELYHSMQYTQTEQAGIIRLDAQIDFAGLELKPVYWDPHVICEWNGVVYRIQAHFVSKKWKLLFYLKNLEFKVDDQFIVFPQYRNGDFLAFTYRESSPYDGTANVLKEACAFGIYKVFGSLLRRRKIWLVFEKQSNSAQDNGYYFFKYCMEQLPPDKNREIYYVIDKRSPDLDRVSMYGRHVVPFMSFRHLLYLLAARIYIGSESKMHVYAWRPKISLIRRQIRNKEIMFLQHGVTALKQDHMIFGAMSGFSMDYFVTTSKFEHDIIEKNFGYASENIPITGFARWDVLEDKSTETDRTILIMPTWRAWLEETGDEAFVQSDYFKNYSALLNDGRLADLLERDNCDVIFYLHPKFAGLIESFFANRREENSRIRLVRFGEEPLNEIMMRARMLITDYSSVCWDMYYQKKPVLFYQFDLEKYNEVHGSYIDMRTELFGQRTEDREELLRMLEETIKNGFCIPEQDCQDYPKYFAYTDDQNSARIYQYLKERVK
ncbi:MAG: CDP-glycerol glycerophosphotransferase family protein [Eubacterium sp.]|nr:CDP-glycerol glycerophosphotransferase family protein [Eubacterium sp.]